MTRVYLVLLGIVLACLLAILIVFIVPPAHSQVMPQWPMPGLGGPVIPGPQYQPYAPHPVPAQPPPVLLAPAPQPLQPFIDPRFRLCVIATYQVVCP